MRIKLTFFICIVFTSNIFPTEISESTVDNNSSNDKDKNIVRLGVLHFINEKGSKDYDFLSESISEDIEKNLKKKFKYKQTSSNENEKVLKKILANKDKKSQPQIITLNDIKELCKKQKLGVVIYGSFKIHQKKGRSVNTVLIKPKLYLHFLKTPVALKSVSSPFSSEIFNVTERVSSIVVKKINRLIRVQSKVQKTVLVSQVNKGSGKEILQKEIIRLKTYLKKTFQGNIFTLSEYLSQNPNIKAPRKLKKNTLLNWRIDSSVANLIRLKLKKKGKQVNIYINQKGGRLEKTSYLLSNKDQDKQIEKAFNKIASVLRATTKEKSPLRQKDFKITSTWDSIYLETGLMVGSGLMFISERNPVLSIEGRLFARVSPGNLSKNKNINFLSDFTHPLLNPLVFELAFGFSYANSEQGGINDIIGITWANNFNYQIYSFSLGVGYGYIFFERFRFLTGVSLLYYLANASLHLNPSHGSGSPGIQDNKSIKAPAFSLHISLHYFLIHYLSLGIRLDYINYLGNSVAGSIASTNQFNALFEVAYLF